MTTPAEATAAIAAHVPRTATEFVPLHAATGRICSEPCRAERDQPPFDRVTMDGIALRFADLEAGHRTFPIAGTQAAGAPAMRLPERACIRIMTGAVLPPGADTVVPVERLTLSEGNATIATDAPTAAGQFIHRQGSDTRQGEETIKPGTRLGPAEVAVFASAGYAQVEVSRLLSVAVVSTGDELVGPQDPIEPYQIRSSNDYAIASALERNNLATVVRSRLADEEAVLLERIAQLHAMHDVLILSGGVSMGQFDFVPGVLEELGCTLIFHRIEQKPGRPMWFGMSRDDKPVFALPGNPVSTLLCMVRYVVPALLAAGGLRPAAAEHYAIDAPVRAPPSLTYFVPVVVDSKPDGRSVAVPKPTNTSGDFATLAATDGFLELPTGTDSHPPGTVGRLYRW